MTTSELFPRPPPVASPTAAPKSTGYDYRPTALRCWFLAGLVVVLITLTVLTEHYMRSLPDYGLDYDFQRLARSLSERQFPRLLPRVQNVTAGATLTPTPADPKTIGILPQAPADTASRELAEPSPFIITSMSSESSDQTTPLFTTTTRNEEPPSPTRSPRSSVQDSTASVASSSTPTPESRTTQKEHTEDLASPRSTADRLSSTSQMSEKHQSPANNGGRQTLDKVVTSVRISPTSTSICFDCGVVPSIATSAYVSLGTGTSTVGIHITISGKETTIKNVVPTTLTTNVHVGPKSSDTPSTTIIQQVTTREERTETVQHITTDSAGSILSQGVVSVVPGATSTIESAVVLDPGQSWGSTTVPLTTFTLSSRTTLQSLTITQEDGDTVTSTYLVTLAPTTAVVTATYGTVVGAGSRPTATSVSSAPSSDTTSNLVVIVVGISRSQYLLGSFLPIIIAILVAMPLRAIDINAQLFQPFIALTAHPAGTTAEESVFLRFYGWRGVLGAFPRAFTLRQPVVIVGQLCVVGAALLPPLAAEAVRVYVPDDCIGVCPGSLGLDVASGRALQVLMALLIALLTAMVGLVALTKTKTGVRQNPWSVASMAALGVNKNIRELLKGMDRGVERRIAEGDLSRALASRRYALGSDGGESQYGVRVTEFPVRLSGELLKRNERRPEKEVQKAAAAGRAPATPFYVLTVQGRVLVLLLFGAVLLLLLCYENSWGDTGFERFMNSQGFGVRFLFTAVGVALGFCMSNFFRCVGVLSPFLLMSQRALPAQRSILISPPTNPISGLYSAVRQRHPYLGVLAVTSLLADFLPVTLSHLPFSVLESYQTQYTCTYLSIATLVAMMLTVAASLAVRWPHMPVDPRTIAGAMYYVCDSSVLSSFDGLAGLEMRDRDWMVRSMCVQYRFGTMVGASGKERIGIDAIGVTD